MTLKKLWPAAFLAALALSLTLGGNVKALWAQEASSPAGASETEGAPESAAPSLDALVQGNSVFAWDLYRVLGREEGNLLFSPISLSEALALAQPGAQGETRAQIDAVARVPKGGGNLNAAFQNLESALTELAGQDIALNLANSLWADKSLHPLESYLANFRDDRASCFQVDFRGDPVGAKDSVNEWVSGQT
ncbi:MAG: hypothetical protein LBO66_02765, partial [Deltaproteobacteria bacterium]|nr:hypothetical protein [Deltaproteobacteria bacterium]